MSFAESLYSALLAEYASGVISLTELSKPDTDKFFIECEYSGFNFDLVKNIAGGKENKEMSPDAMFLKNDEIYFVEFKSGAYDKKELRSKIHEGLTTLYQFSVNRGIVNREDFFKIKVNYVVIAAAKRDGKGSRFLDVMQMGAGYFGLKNLEGFLLQKTSLLSKPEVIHAKLKEISSGDLGVFKFHCPVNGVVQF